MVSRVRGDDDFDSRASAAFAWVSFNGEGGAVINSSHNVQSVVRNGLGDYTVTLENSAPNSDYAFSLSALDATGLFLTGTSKSSNSLRFRAINVSGSGNDATDVCVVIYSL